MLLYAAYGLELNEKYMAEISNGTAVKVSRALMKDTKLVFRGGHLDIQHEQGMVVPVGIWLLDEKTIQKIDGRVFYPKFSAREWDSPKLFYFLDNDNQNLPIQMNALTGYGKTYFLNNTKLKDEEVEIIRQGYKDFNLQDWLWLFEKTVKIERGIELTTDIKQKIKDISQKENIDLTPVKKIAFR